MIKRIIILLVVVLGIFSILSIASHSLNAAVPERVVDTTFLTAPTESMIDLINSNVIHFDHASVGSNTTSGLSTIVINSKQVELIDNARGNPPAAEKVTNWRDLLIARNTDGTPDDDIDIAAFKWCYIDDQDVYNSTTPDNLAGLITAITELRSHVNPRVSGIKLVIFTVPLETSASAAKVEDNIRIRNLTSTFAGLWVYDIADFESRHTNGSQCLVGGVPVLCAEYTSDGGHPSTAEGESRVGTGFLLSLYQAASSSALTPTPVPTVPTTLKNVYFTFGKLRYGRYAGPSQLRAGDYIYLKNYDPKKLKLLAISLYDYTKKGNQCYTRTWRNSTTMYMRTCSLLPTKRKYAFIFTFRDTATSVVVKKYFVVNTISSGTVTY
jgi:hypothetical protein